MKLSVLYENLDFVWKYKVGLVGEMFPKKREL